MQKDTTAAWEGPQAPPEDNGLPKVEVFTVDSSSSLIAPKKQGVVHLPKKPPKERPWSLTSHAAQSQAPAQTPTPYTGYGAPGQYPAGAPGTNYNYYAQTSAPYDQTNQYAFYPPGTYPQYDPNALPPVVTEKKKAIYQPPTRRGGGAEWDDPTLREWAQDDYRIFVGNLGNEVSDEQLRRAFMHYKSISKAKVLRDKKTGKTRGYGFVSFMAPQDYIKALKEMQGKYICNRPCKLSKSRWKERNIEQK